MPSKFPSGGGEPTRHSGDGEPEGSATSVRVPQVEAKRLLAITPPPQNMISQPKADNSANPDGPGQESHEVRPHAPGAHHHARDQGQVQADQVEDAAETGHAFVGTRPTSFGHQKCRPA